jgi:hypothetical protein
VSRFIRHLGGAGEWRALREGGTPATDAKMRDAESGVKEIEAKREGEKGKSDSSFVPP